jgi:hypothetical protein
MFRLLLVAVGVSVLASGAAAGVPDPGLSIAPNVIFAPSGGITYTVHVEAIDGPVDSAIVQLVFSGQAAGLVCWCTGQAEPIISATSDGSGDANFNIAAGGCVDPAAGGVTPPVVEVYANGIKLAEVGCVSPDIVDGGGLRATEGWNPAGTCRPAIGDAAELTNPLSTGIYDFCADANSDLVVTLSDAVIFSDDLSSGTTCTQAP